MVVWQMFFCLTLISFVCRAAIPAGYMPDSSSPQDRSFAITLCSGGGSAGLMYIDFFDDPDTPSSDTAYGIAECPYGLSAANKLIGPPDALRVVARPSDVPMWISFGNVSPPYAAYLGPPLGSRAPPILAS